MFWNQRKELETKTKENIFLKNKKEELRRDREEVIRRAENVITKAGAVSLYPDGPDKEKALKDLEYAKESLLSAIGIHDGNRQEMQDMQKSYNDYSHGREKDSHFWVEFAYRDYFRR